MLPEPLILGVLTFQVLYALVQWYFFRRREYLFYGLYSIVIAVYFFVQYRVDNHHLTFGDFRLHDAVVTILTNIFIYLALISYVIFGRLFIDAPTIIPNLDKGVRIAIRLMYAYMVVGTLWIISGYHPQLQRIVHLTVSLSFFVFFVYVLYRVLITGSVLGRFLVSGSILMTSSVAYNLIYRNLNPNPLPGELSGFFFVQMGVILELICLNIGLIYKSKQIMEATAGSGQLVSEQLQENERQLSDLNAVRKEISHELKLELGDGLSGIKLMSDMVQQKMGDNQMKELERISENSERLVQSMNEIVWSLNRQNDDLPGLISYLREYAMSFMDQVGFHATLSEPEHIPGISIPGDTRRHIFLAVKEALHNAVKHSGSRNIDISLGITDSLKIIIKDNGKGMDTDVRPSYGNGLRNMKKRMDFLKGNIDIINENGVTIVFEIPLPQTIK